MHAANQLLYLSNNYADDVYRNAISSTSFQKIKSINMELALLNNLQHIQKNMNVVIIKAVVKGLPYDYKWIKTCTFSHFIQTSLKQSCKS